MTGPAATFSEHPDTAREFLLAVFLERESDIRSPKGLYDYPPMWSLLTRDDRTLAIRPAVAQVREGFEFREAPGIGWGWHRDGEWTVGEQHCSSTHDYFIENVLIPVLSAGAVLREAPQAEISSPAP